MAEASKKLSLDDMVILTMEQLGERMAQLGWESALSVCTREAIDGQVLPLLTKGDLDELGVPHEVRAKIAEWQEMEQEHMKNL
jgi:hypothetical protein